MTKDIILNTDSYKLTHWKQTPPGTEFISSYIESRGGPFEEIVTMGIGAFLHDFKETLTKHDVDEAAEMMALHGFDINVESWKKLVDWQSDHPGALPLEIQAIPEGTIVKPGIPLIQVRNTVPEFYWLTSYIETRLLRAIWYPTTVATISREAKKKIYKYLQKSSDDPDGEIAFKLHDFGARGVSSQESAGLGGMAHLVNFMGTDNIDALLLARKVYGEKMAGHSIDASEHMTITSWGGPAHEGEAFKNMIIQFGKPGKMFACVSDSYSIYRACTSLWGGLLKDRIQRLGDHGTTLVVRPDSGEPKAVVRDVITMLMDAFGFKRNSKGYSVLPPYLRVIQGDGVNLDSIQEILDELDAHKISGSNIAFGMGGALLQKVDRDTLKFAMKCNEVTVNGEPRDVYKQPISDVTKSSKAGRQAVIREHGDWHSIRETALGDRDNELKVMYFEGEKYHDDTTFTEIRERAALVTD